MVYVISDLHGYPLEKIEGLFEKAGFGNDDFCFVLGDVVDRGNDGIKILKWLMYKDNMELILGNHEALMLSCRFLFEEITDELLETLAPDSLDILELWKDNGGEPTIRAIAALYPEERAEIVDYLSDAPLYDSVTVAGKDYLLTHSGIDDFEPGKKLSEYSAADFLWNRPSLDDSYFDDVVTVFGHTPTGLYGREYAGKPIITDTWIDIDVGAASGRAPLLLRLDDMKEFYAE